MFLVFLVGGEGWREAHVSVRATVPEANAWVVSGNEWFRKIRGTFLGVPIIRFSTLGSILGSARLGQLPHGFLGFTYSVAQDA